MVRARDSVEPDLESATDARANNQHLIYTGCSLAYLVLFVSRPLQPIQALRFETRWSPCVSESAVMFADAF
jgi:hypothetical protein